VAMGNASTRNRSLQRRRDVRLHGNVAEALRAIFSGESEHKALSVERRAWSAELEVCGIYSAAPAVTKKNSRGAAAQRATIPERMPQADRSDKRHFMPLLPSGS